MFAYINPLFAIPAGIIIAGEKLEISMIFPLILIAIGIIVAVKEKFHSKTLLIQQLITKITLIHSLYLGFA